MTPFKTHCKRGHPLTPSNILWTKVRKWRTRRCKRCHADRCRDRYRANPVYREATKKRTREARQRVIFLERLIPVEC